MRRLVISGLAAAVAGALAAGAASAETTRTLSARVPAPAARRLAVENLVGRMKVTPSSDGTLTVTATVHAENGTLASSVRLEERKAADGTAVLHVVYPDKSRIRYPDLCRQESDGGRGWSFFLFGDCTTSQEYDGRRYRIAQRHGDILYVDLDVRVPQGVRAAIENRAGYLDAENLKGDMDLEIGCADAHLTSLSGAITLHGGSGDVRADHLSGSWRSHLGSGDIRMRDARFDSAEFEAGSGDVSADRLSASHLSTEAGSGDVQIRDADLAEYRGRAGSGDISIEEESARLASFRAHTGSGDVTLKVPEGTGLVAHHAHGSGDFNVNFRDGERERDHRGELVSYRRGSGAVQIDVETGSGDFTLGPR